MYVLLMTELQGQARPKAPGELNQGTSAKGGGAEQHLYVCVVTWGVSQALGTLQCTHTVGDAVPSADECFGVQGQFLLQCIRAGRGSG